MGLMSALALTITNMSKNKAEEEFLTAEISELINGTLHHEDASTKSLDIIHQFEHDEQMNLINWAPKVPYEGFEPNWEEYPDHEYRKDYV